MLGCGRVFDYSTKAAQLSMNSLNWLHWLFQPCPRDCNINAADLHFINTPEFGCWHIVSDD
jgi:hypothetical protein